MVMLEKHHISFIENFLFNKKSIEINIEHSNDINILEECNIEDLHKLKKINNIIDITFNSLSPINKEIVRLRYMEKKLWKEISENLHYDADTIRKYKNESLKSFAISLWGSSILKKESKELFESVDV